VLSCQTASTISVQAGNDRTWWFWQPLYSCCCRNATTD